MEVKKIVVDNADEMTSDEKDMCMLREIEKQLGTGPIIGEAREVILTLSRNLMIRDLMLTAMGCDIEKRENLFNEVNSMLEKEDKRIMKARGKAQK